ncbi:MAG: hypothetical protein HZA31_11785 [Opitutae bacterium]|nr:hypothetical protein [Opitutae bacterium]
MITSKHVLFGAVLAGCAVLSSGTAFAQMQAGLLGKQYVQAAYFTEDIRKPSNIDNGNGASFGVNLPLMPNVDLGLGGYYESISTNDFTNKRLTATVTGYQEVNGFKPFIDVSLASDWQSSSYRGVDYSKTTGVYALGVGVEAPVSDNTALFGRIAYNKYFNGMTSRYYTYAFGFNHWFTPKVAGMASVSFWENDSVTYSVGLGYRF